MTTIDILILIIFILVIYSCVATAGWILNYKDYKWWKDMAHRAVDHFHEAVRLCLNLEKQVDELEKRIKESHDDKQ